MSYQNLLEILHCLLNKVDSLGPIMKAMRHDEGPDVVVLCFDIFAVTSSREVLQFLRWMGYSSLDWFAKY
jgi:hypothetical protein